MKKVNEKVIDYVIEVSDNSFVEDINPNKAKITYTKDFYVVLYKKLESGMKSVEAYESMGFDTKILGKDRAYAAAERAKKLGDKKGFTIDPSNYDGSATRSEMGELTPEEELAYLQARNIYLEELVELQKKLPTILEEMSISYKNQ